MDDSANTSPETHRESDEFNYRPFSKLAIVGLLLGLLSVAAFASPALWVVPVIAIAIGSMVWRRANRGEVAGGWLAVIGIILAVFCGASAIGYHQVRLSALKSSTRDYAQQWLEMVDAGNVDKAFQYFIEARGDTKLPAETYEQYYADEPARREALDQLLALAPVHDLVEHDGELVWKSSSVVRCRRKIAFVLHRFQFQYEDGGQSVERPIVLHLAGQLNQAQDTMEWFVYDVE